MIPGVIHWWCPHRLEISSRRYLIRDLLHLSDTDVVGLLSITPHMVQVLQRLIDGMVLLLMLLASTVIPDVLTLR